MPASTPLIPLAHDRPSPAISSSHPAASSSLLPSTASSPPNTAPAPPLSAKARGKQRENPFLPQPSPSSDSPQRKDRPASRQLTIRFTSEGAADLALVLEPGETIRQLRARIKTLRPTLSSNPLRFIHLGRILPPETNILPTLTRKRRLKLSEEDAKGKKKASGEGTADGVEEEEESLWLQCSVGLAVEDGEEEGKLEERQGEEAAAAQTAPLRGFDLLRSTAGMTEEDIAIMRRQFHGGAAAEDLNPNSAAELEERFLDGSLTPETDPRNAVDKYLTLLQGLLTSFIFPLTPLFFWDEHPQHSFLSPGMREETGRSVVFSRRMEISLIIGLFLNLGFGALKLMAS